MADDNDEIYSDNSRHGGSLPGDIREAAALSIASAASQSAQLENLTYANTIANVNLSQQNAAANGQEADQLSLAVTGKAVELVANPAPLEGFALDVLENANDVGADLAEMKARARALLSRRKPC